MKIKILTSALFTFVAVSAFAQKGELNTAKEEYTKFDGLRANMALAKPSLANAKTAIDKASTNQKTSALPETIALKAAIYASLASIDTDPTAAASDLATAQDALAKAQAADTKNENTNMIKHAQVEMAQIQLNNGVKAFQNKNYDEAYKAFSAAHKTLPDDTTAMLYAGISASNAKNYPDAIESYKELVNTNYSKKTQAYNDMTTLYLYNKDTTGALKVIGEAVAKNPNNADLRKREIEVSLQAGQSADLITKIDNAIKADPNNKTLYYYEGLTYSQVAENEGREITKLKKADAKATAAKPGTKAAPNPQIAKLQQMRNDNYAKAAAQYQKALAIDPNYFEAVLNMGYVSIAPAIDLYNEAQQLPVTQTKLYNEDMAKANAGFDAAKPYVTKAVELNPQSVDALTNLKSYYLGKKDADNANAVQKKIDALPKQ
ncbi:MAG: tetratricopeptide repeat protein [Bacteroidetes bacterium]|nr:tetratricopeptide repeat protein [Bacteroidota bacterium]